MQKLYASFNGTDASVYLCIGAIPVACKLTNVGASTNPNFIEWNRGMMNEITCSTGMIMLGATGIYTKAVATSDVTGIIPYEGGELLTTANQTDVTYGGGVYLGWDLKDYRADNTYGALSGSINKWTLDTAANRTGHFNVAGVASGSKIGAGSIIRIKEYSSGLVKEATINVVTSQTYTTADYVELSRAIGSGDVVFIGGKYTLAPIPVGKVTPAGILLSDATHIICDNDNVIACEFTLEEAR